MSAELLREAATQMRERADAAMAPLTDDWWETNALKWLQRTSGVPSLAEHMTSWHPAVALATAYALEQHAEQHSPSAARNECIWEEWACGLLDLARAYLGRDA